MCGSDEPTRHEPQTRCQKLLVRLQALIFSGLAVYTIISLILALEQVGRTDLKLSENPPSDRCVPFFDDVKAFKEKTALTKALYDYRNGDAIVRICTNETRSTVLAAIGPQFAYDPWKADTGCDVLGADKQQFIDNCERVNFQAGDPTTCGDILNVTPLPYGAHWNMFTQLLTGNKTLNTTYPPCSIRVTRIADIAPCSQSTMVPMHELNTNVAVLIRFGVSVPFIVMLLQCVATYFYSKSWAAEDGWLLAFACRGIPGSFYMLYWVCHEGEEGRGEFPEIFLNFWGWLACAIQDALEGLAVPLVAILGCRLDRYPLNLLLVILKCIKFLFDFFMYLKHRTETCEPGGEAAQRAVWAACPPPPSEMKQNRTPQAAFPHPTMYPSNAV